MEKAIELIKSSWSFFSENINKLWPVALLLALPSIFSAFSSGGEDLSSDPQDFASFSEFTDTAFGVSAGAFGLAVLIFLVISVVYTTLVYGGSIKLLLESLRGKDSDFGVGNIFKKGSGFLGGLILLGLVTGFVTFVGFLLLVIPGLIAAFLLSLSFHYMVDKNLGVGGAMSASFNTVKDNVGSVLAVYIGMFLIGLAVSIVAGILFAADDIWIVRVLSAVVGGFIGLFGVVVVSKLYIFLDGKAKDPKPDNS